MSDVSIRFIADVEDVISNIDKIEDATKDTVSASQKHLSKLGTGRASAGLDKLQRSATKAGKGVKDLEERAGDADSVLKALGGAIGEVNPELGRMVSMSGEAGSAIEALVRVGTRGLAVLGMVAPIALAAAAAYLILADRLAKAEQAQKDAADAATDAQRIYKGLKTDVANLSREFDLATGALSKFENEVAQGEAKIEEAYHDGEVAAHKRIRATEAAIKAEEARRLEEGLGIKATEESIAKTDRLSRDLETQRKILGKLITNKRELKGASFDAAVANEEERLKSQAATEASNQQTAALEREAAARRKANDAISAMATELDAMAQLRQIEIAQGADAEVAEAIRRTEAITALEKKAGVIGTAEAERFAAAREAVWAELADKRKGLAREIAAEERAAQNAYLDGLSTQREDEIATAEERKELALSVRDAAIGAAGDIASAVTGTIQASAQAEIDAVSEKIREEQSLHEQQIAELEAKRDEASGAERQRLSSEIAEKRRAHAEQQEILGEELVTAFKKRQAAARSEAVIQGALAAVTAVAQLGPIAGAVAATGIAATVAAQIAAIEAEQPPSFHAGGRFDRPGHRERDVRVRTDEGAVTSQGINALGGSAALDRLNAGSAPAGVQQVTWLDSARVVDRMIAKNKARHGAAYQPKARRRNPYRKAL